MKISEENIKLVLAELGIDPATAERVVYEAKKKDEQEKLPKDPRQKEGPDWVVIVNDPENKIPDDTTVWVLQKKRIDDEEQGQQTKWGDLEAETRLRACCSAMRDDARLMRRLGSVDCLADVLEYGPARLMKSNGVVVKTKTPVALVKVVGDNVIRAQAQEED